MQKVAVLVTARNCRDRLLAALESCFIQIDEMKNEDVYAFEVYLLDAESKDGTSEAVSGKFPAVRLTRAEAEGEWNHGLRLLWDIAAADRPDFYIWLDPEIDLAKGALACLMRNSELLGHKALIVGTVSDVDGTSCVCGGRNREGRIIVPDPVLPVPCMTFDGKLVLIPENVYRRLGSLDPVFRCRYADRDYGCRAHKAGVTQVAAPGILAKFSSARPLPVWRDAAYSLKQRYLALDTPEGCPLKEKFIYDLRSVGLLAAVGRSLSTGLRVLFPKRK